MSGNDQVDNLEFGTLEEPEHKRKYMQVGNEQRKELLNMLQNEHLSIKTAAGRCSINYSNAKNIVKIFQKENRMRKLSRAIPSKWPYFHMEKRQKPIATESEGMKIFEDLENGKEVSHSDFKESAESKKSTKEQSEVNPLPENNNVQQSLLMQNDLAQGQVSRVPLANNEEEDSEDPPSEDVFDFTPYTPAILSRSQFFIHFF